MSKRMVVREDRMSGLTCRYCQDPVDLSAGNDIQEEFMYNMIDTYHAMIEDNKDTHSLLGAFYICLNCLFAQTDA